MDHGKIAYDAYRILVKDVLPKSLDTLELNSWEELRSPYRGLWNQVAAAIIADLAKSNVILEKKKIGFDRLVATFYRKYRRVMTLHGMPVVEQDHLRESDADAINEGLKDAIFRLVGSQTIVDELIDFEPDLKLIKLKDLTYIDRKLDTKFLKMLESVQENGITTPIDVRSNRDGKYTLVDGYLRAKACEAIGLLTIPAKLVR